MKKTLPALLLLISAFGLQGQATFIPDTILVQHFTVDPSDTMLVFPSGNDLQWVNWDADNLPTLCQGGPGEVIPGNWYWESDFGDPNNPPLNSAFTSCSHQKYKNDSFPQPNENWLITPPVFVQDSDTYLSWRSLSFEGPGYVDGYKVLVSTSTNEPFTGAFKDTVFVAGEMLRYTIFGSLNPNHYIFSPGYIHANRYTDTAYYFLNPEYPYGYMGRLEPHQVSLAKYAGQKVYIAFLHDSTDDNLIQIDDIAVIRGPISASWEPGASHYYLQCQPNPVEAYTTISWKLPVRQEGRLVVKDLLGRTVVEYLLDLGSGEFQLHTEIWPTGTYACSLQTATGQQTILLVKQ